MSAAVTRTIEPTTEHVGPIEIRRYLPNRKQQMVGPFIFMDQGGPLELPGGSGGGVPEHPHAGLSTFTYLMAGSVRHTDSAGNTAVVERGDVALMTAGSGITHEEMPSGDGAPSTTRTIEFAQMWLALPDEVEDAEPMFQHVRKPDLPTLDLDRGTARVAVGTGWGITAPTRTETDTIFAELAIAPGGTVTIEPKWDERALILLDGDALLNGSRMTPLDLPILDQGATVKLTSTTGARLLLFGGERFPSDRYIAASFVGSSPDKIEHWMTDYATGNFPRIDRG